MGRGLERGGRDAQLEGGLKRESERETNTVLEGSRGEVS